jgi:hypothetical protein
MLTFVTPRSANSLIAAAWMRRRAWLGGTPGSAGMAEAAAGSKLNISAQF